MTFPRFNIEQSATEFYTSQSGVALVGLAINRFTSLASRATKAAPCKGIATADVLRCYLGLLCQGESDFEAIRPFFEDEAFFAAALGVKKVPSPETLSQRLGAVAEATLRIVDFCTVELLKKPRPSSQPLRQVICRRNWTYSPRTTPIPRAVLPIRKNNPG